MGYYLTKVQFEKTQKAETASVQYHIGTVYGSNVGTYGNASVSNTFNFEAVDQMIEDRGGEDKEELRQIIAEIKELFEDSEKVKKGSLAKYSEKIDKHSWIAGPLAQMALGFLSGQMFKQNLYFNGEWSNVCPKILGYERLDCEQHLHLFQMLRASMLPLLENLTPEQLERVGQYPDGVRYTFKELLELCDQHVRDHLAQIQRVKQAYREDWA